MAAYGAAISQHPDPAAAVGDVVGSVLEQVGHQPDTAVLFASSEHIDSIHDIVESVRSLLAPRVLIGATAEAVIGGTLEAEEGPAISLWAGRLGAVEAGCGSSRAPNAFVTGRTPNLPGQRAHARREPPVSRLANRGWRRFLLGS
jgi:small ligand-binding sensory domain FIST